MRTNKMLWHERVSKNMTTSSISRRMESCINAFQNNDFETALIHYFPALDKTAKRRREKSKVGERIRKFIDDELEIITHIATRNIFRIDCDGITFPQAIYKFGRTSIAHEGELDPRLNFNNQNGLSIGQTWNLPPEFLIGLILVVITAPENSGEKFSQEYTLNIHDKQFQLNEIWGERIQIRGWMEELYGRPLFDKKP